MLENPPKNKTDPFPPVIGMFCTKLHLRHTAHCHHALGTIERIDRRADDDVPRPSALLLLVVTTSTSGEENDHREGIVLAN